MRLRFYLGICLLSALTVLSDDVRVIKVLPQLLDLQGRNAVNPSLFERDAYQLHLRQNPAEVSALRFDVQYKARGVEGPLKLRLEVRGSKTGLKEHHIFETDVKAGARFSKWGHIQLDRATSETIGTLIAWRASLVKGGEVITQQESFLW